MFYCTFLRDGPQSVPAKNLRRTGETNGIVEYTQLAETGLQVSQLCFGTWRFGKETNGTIETDREQAHELLDAAWDLGINFIDTANSYGGGKSERYIGEWLAEYDREDFVIASKVLWATRGTSIEALGESMGPVQRKGVSRKSIRAEVEATLERLGTDYLDVYYVHSWHDGIPVRETLSTLDELVREGTVHSLAVSNVAGWELTKALWQSDVHGWDRFDIVQPKYNATFREPVAELLEVCTDQNVAVCPYSPLEGGFLSGKYDRDGSPPPGSRGDLSSWDDRFSERQWRVLDAIRAVADELDATPAQVALRWLIDGDVPTVPIVGARTPEQLTDSAGAADISLIDEHRHRIDEAY